MNDLKINQEVICLKTHSLGLVTKNETYKVKATLRPPCVCAHLLVDVGVLAPLPNSKCLCGISYPNGGVAWLNEALFAPLPSIEEVMEKINNQKIQL